MMRTEDAWQGMPKTFNKHDLNVQSFKGFLASCTKYQLEVEMFASNPYKVFLVLDTETLGRSTWAAFEVQKNYRDDPCTLDPQWFAHMQEFPSAGHV